MPPLRRISSSFGDERHRLVGLALRLVASAAATRGSNVNSSPSCASATASGLCTTCSPRLKALRRKMSPMLWPQTIDHLEPDFLGDALEARRAHLARRSDREAIAGDDERLAAVHARAEVGHQVAERARLPALVERLEALGHAVGRGRDLVGVDGVELAGELRARQALRIPEDERPARDQRRPAPRGWAPSRRWPGPPARCGPSRPASAEPVQSRAYLSPMLAKAAPIRSFPDRRPSSSGAGTKPVHRRTGQRRVFGEAGHRWRRGGRDRSGNRGRCE